MIKKLSQLTAAIASLLFVGMTANAEAQVFQQRSTVADQSAESRVFNDLSNDDEEVFFDALYNHFNAKAATSFDYYLLAMSWSPDYCSTHPSDSQCGKGYAFVIHGLWPQNLSGSNPSSCPSSFTLTQSAINVALPYMPSNTLISHEWSKHGVCAGTSSLTYFTNAVNAFKSITVPSYLAKPVANKTVSLSTLRSDFAKSTGLTSNQFAVICDGSKLQEVRVCLTKQLGAQTCGAGISDSCPSNVTVLK